MIGVLVISDVQIFREGLVIALARQGKFDLCQAASRPREAMRVIRRKAPRVALVDQSMAGSVSVMTEIARYAPDVAQIALAVEEKSPQILSCAEAGAVGFVARDASLADLSQAIFDAETGTLRCKPEIAHMLFCHVGKMQNNGAANGSCSGLTRREQQILELIEQGQSNKVIAFELGIGLSTVKNHVHSLLAKLGVRRRGEAAAMHRRRLQ